MAVSRDDVRAMARLARLHVAPGEEERFASDLSDLLDYAEQLGQLDLDGVPPMSRVPGVHVTLREDAVVERTMREDALAAAPDADDAFFRVPKVID